MEVEGEADSLVRAAGPLEHLPKEWPSSGRADWYSAERANLDEQDGLVKLRRREWSDLGCPSTGRVIRSNALKEETAPCGGSAFWSVAGLHAHESAGFLLFGTLLRCRQGERDEDSQRGKQEFHERHYATRPVTRS